MKLTKRQLEILNASLQTISEEGVQNFTMRQVASVVGVTEPAIYRHFANKNAILEALIKQLQGAFAMLAKQHLRNNGIDDLTRFFRAVLSHLAERPALSSIIFSEELFQNEPTLKEGVVAIMQSVEAQIKEQIEALPERDPTMPAQQLSWLLLGSLRFFVTRWRLSHFGFDLCEEGEQFIDNLLTLISNQNEGEQQNEE